MITEKLIPLLRDHFQKQRVTFGASPSAIAIFSCVHPDVGDVKILEHGSEVIVVVGNFTHGHFADFDSKSAEEAEQKIADSVVSFLKRLFADEIVMWGSHHASGGWYARGQRDDKHAIKPTGPLYVWSGPLVAD